MVYELFLIFILFQVSGSSALRVLWELRWSRGPQVSAGDGRSSTAAPPERWSEATINGPRLRRGEGEKLRERAACRPAGNPESVPGGEGRLLLQGCPCSGPQRARLCTGGIRICSVLIGQSHIFQLVGVEPL